MDKNQAYKCMKCGTLFDNNPPGLVNAVHCCEAGAKLVDVPEEEIPDAEDVNLKFTPAELIRC